MKFLGWCFLLLLVVAGCNGVLSSLPESNDSTETELTQPESNDSTKTELTQDLRIGELGPAGGVVSYIAKDFVIEAVYSPWKSESFKPKVVISTALNPWCNGMQSLAWFDEGPPHIGKANGMGVGQQATKQVVQRIDWNFAKYASVGLEYEECLGKTDIFHWISQSVINGFSDWYIPTQYEMERITRFEKLRNLLNANSRELGDDCDYICSGTFVTSTVNDSGNLIFWNSRDDSMGTFSWYPVVLFLHKTLIGQ